MTIKNVDLDWFPVKMLMIVYVTRGVVLEKEMWEHCSHPTTPLIWVKAEL